MKLKDWERNLHNTLQGEINMARSQKQDLTCIAFFKENETRFLKGIHFEWQMYRNREEYLIRHTNDKINIQENVRTFKM